MVAVVIDDITPREQFTATALQTVFNTLFTADATTDIDVYARADGVEPDDVAQLVLPADYTVTFVGASATTRVTFAVGRTLDDIITIVRNTPSDRENLYINTNFTPSMLNEDFGLLTMIDQQNQMYDTVIAPHYNVSAIIDPVIDIILPILEENQIWAMNPGATEIIAYDVPAGGGLAPADATYVLQIADSDLPNAQAMGALASGLVVNTTATGVQLTRTLTETASETSVLNGDGIAGNPTIGIADNPVLPGTGGVTLPGGTTAQRAGGAGTLRFNSTATLFEGTVDGVVWDSIPGAGSTVNSVLGTANEVDVDNTDPTVPVVGLSATIDTPGTFTIATTIVLDSIIDDDTMATATATNIPTSESVVAYITATAGGAGGSNTEIQFNNAGALDGDSGFTTNGAGSINIVGDLDIDSLNINGNAITSTSGVVDITPLAGENLTITVSGDGELILTGQMDIIHTSSGSDEHALKIDMNAAGFGDSKAIDISYTTGALAANSEEGVIVVNIDDTLSSGGEVFGLEVITTPGTASVFAVRAGALVSPVEQLTGTFGNADSILNIAVDVAADLANGGAGNITAFVADDDTFTVGDAATFEEISFELATVASQNIQPTFRFSTGSGTWASFTPTDGTNGMRNTGVIVWDLADVPAWAVGTSGDYLIEIKRTRNNVVTDPIMTEVQISAVTEYLWDKTGTLAVKSVTVDADPTTPLMLATKQYVDSRTDLHYMASVLAASIGDFASTYDNGTAGVGATLTATGNGAFTLDGQAGVLNGRYLIKNQTTTFENGVYTLTQVGTAGTPAILTRAVDFDEPSEIDPGDIVPVINGTINAVSTWLQTATVTTIGTDAILFTQWSATALDTSSISFSMMLMGG